MKLRNFKAICEKCDGIRCQIESGTISAKSAIVGLSEYIDYLQKEYNQNGVNLKEDCRNQMFSTKANKIYGPYRRWRDEQKESLNFYLSQIEATISELDNNKTDYPEDESKGLISALNRLYSLASSLSHICFIELGIVKKPGRKKKPEVSEESNAKAIEECRERIRNTQAYQDAAERGLFVGFKWRHTLGNLADWLIRNGISTNSISVSWNIVDGVFIDKKGNPISKDKLYSAYSQRKKNYRKTTDKI